MASSEVQRRPPPEFSGTCNQDDRPTMSALISVTTSEGTDLRVIDSICSSSNHKCRDFAEVLLNDGTTVATIKAENEDKKDFVRAVLRCWLDKNDDDPGDKACTWGALADSIEKAGLEGKLVRAIRNMCTTSTPEPTTCKSPLVTCSLQLSLSVEVSYKVVVVGDVGTGKTSIVNRYTNGEYLPDSYPYTSGADYSKRVLEWDNSTIQLDICEIGGQEQNRALTEVYYRGADGAVIVFDLKDKRTFMAVDVWMEDVRGKTKLPNGDPIPVVIFANKSDLKRTFVDNIDGVLNGYCDRHVQVSWLATSAKENSGIDEAFRNLVDKMKMNRKISLTTDMKPIVAGQQPTEKRSKCCHCCCLM